MNHLLNLFKPSTLCSGRPKVLLGMMLLLAFHAKAQTTLTGTVISDSDNETLIGVSVMEQNSQNGQVTDANGQFSLSVAALPCQLKFSYVGFDTQVVEVTSKDPLTIRLQESSRTLNEVVVVGYGVQKKKLVTGATVQVKGDDIQKLNTVSPLAALQSQTPGVNITQASGMPGSGFKVVVRGLGTTGAATPLYNRWYYRW